jgi:Dyp-type peroxidase family
MAIDLSVPLSWKSTDAEIVALLDDLQGNILDGHGRKATRHIFLRFTDADGARRFLADLAPDVMTAKRQFAEAEAFRDHGIPGGPVLTVQLAFAGYEALGLAGSAPDDPAFRAGMAARFDLLNDPPRDALEPPYQGAIHAMILIGADPDADDAWTSTKADAIAADIIARLGSAGEVVTIEKGRAIFRCGDGSTPETPVKVEGIEHFGYADGRSQPLMVTEMIKREEQESDGTSVWSPVFAPSQVLVDDPGSDLPHAFGSYFVFRKLEQDVAGFKADEEALGEQTGLGELAGAMLVGRFEDGTPVTLQREEGGDNPVMNNFDYAGDMDGLRCPFHAHIRKTNPRGDTVRLFGASLDEERSHIMARRGMTYGERDAVMNPSDEPSGGVGLMFMAFQRDLVNQFEFTQQSWANSPQFATGFAGLPSPGRDPIIGQSGTNPPETITVRDRWGWERAGTRQVSFAEYVRHRGGEYFFAPAISTLRALAPATIEAAAA